MPLGKALLEGGGKAASFEEIGDEAGGVVISAEMRPRSDTSMPWLLAQARTAARSVRGLSERPARRRD